MIFGYSSNAYKNVSLVEAIDRIAAKGFGGLEIMCDRPHMFPPDVDNAELDAICRRISRNNLKITNLNCFTLFAVGDTYLPSWIESDSNRREMRIQHTLDCLKIAGRLGCRNISIPPGGPLNGMERKRAVRLFLHGLEKVVPLAEELGVKLLIEPEPELLIENTREFTSFIKSVQSSMVGLNFDIGHFFCVGEDPRIAFEELFEWIGHMHLEDIASDRTHVHLIPGRGAIDFLDFFKALKRLGYLGDISLELYTCVNAPDEAGEESLEYLAPLFAAAGLEIQRARG
jgi:sugar phosphate isomerase/epimerase